MAGDLPTAELVVQRRGSLYEAVGTSMRVQDSRLPGFTEALTRVLTLGSVDTAEAARTHAALVITPPNEGVGMLEWHQLDRMWAAGPRAALESLERAPAAVFG